MQSRRPSRAIGRCRKPRCRLSGAETTLDVRTVQSRQRGKARIEVANLTTRLSLAEATPQPVEPEEQPAAATLPEAALSFQAAVESMPVTAEPGPVNEQPVIDLDPIEVLPLQVQPRTAPVAAAKPEAPPAPPAAAPLEDEETDDFLLAPLPLPGTMATPVPEKPADPLAPLRTLSAHELIALFT
jgi:hypothetical protein